MESSVNNRFEHLINQLPHDIHSLILSFIIMKQKVIFDLSTPDNTEKSLTFTLIPKCRDKVIIKDVIETDIKKKYTIKDYSNTLCWVMNLDRINLGWSDGMKRSMMESNIKALYTRRSMMHETIRRIIAAMFNDKVRKALIDDIMSLNYNTWSEIHSILLEFSNNWSSKGYFCILCDMLAFNILGRVVPRIYRLGKNVYFIRKGEKLISSETQIRTWGDDVTVMYSRSYFERAVEVKYSYPKLPNYLVWMKNYATVSQWNNLRTTSRRKYG